jgi:gliding motility-associated-like protein
MSFSTAVKSYTARVPASTDWEEVTATLSDTTATAYVNNENGDPVTSTSAVELFYGTSLITVVAYTQDGTAIQIDTIKITKAAANLSTNAILTSIATTPGTTLTEGAGQGYKNYTTNVANSISSIQITPTAQDSTATIKINGAAILSGALSQPISLNAGANIIDIEVTAQDGATVKSYIITVSRAPSSNAAISVIKLTPKTTLTVVSGPGNANYTTPVPFSESSLTITPTAQDANATIKVNGVAVASGAASQSIPLSVGDNVITIIATAQDGATTRSYIITATRAGASVATLQSLATSNGALSPVFAAATTLYSTIVPNATSSVKITPAATDVNATITVNGAAVISGAASASIPLNVGSNAITTVVTAQDGTTTKTYTITVTRAAAGLSTNAVISVIKLTPKTALTVVSGPGSANYTTPVPFSESSLTITPTAQDANTTIKVNGVAVASGAASQNIPLSVGNNVITIVATAQDGATTRNYIITATRAGAAVATLANLTLSSGTLSPAFASATTGYSATAPNATSSVKITPVATDANATIKVNGATVLSGAASAGVPLNVGSNAITTVVTAQDGTTTKTYTVTVTRAASTNAVLIGIKATPSTTLTLVTGADYRDYTTTVPNTETSVKITATTQDATATIKVNGVPVASGIVSAAIPLNVGANVINTVVTAQDGITTKTYSIKFTRQPPAGFVMKEETAEQPIVADVLTVHQNVSPNGDGNSDVLVIDGIAAHPDNKLQIMSRNGVLVYETKGYDNTNNAFDGHSSISGKLQQAGTYMYSLEYKDGDGTKHKTGFIVLKY